MIYVYVQTLERNKPNVFHVLQQNVFYLNPDSCSYKWEHEGVFTAADCPAPDSWQSVVSRFPELKHMCTVWIWPVVGSPLEPVALQAHQSCVRAAGAQLSSFFTCARSGIPSSCFRMCSLQGYEEIARRELTDFKWVYQHVDEKSEPESKQLLRNDWKLISKFVWGRHWWGWELLLTWWMGRKDTWKAEESDTKEKECKKAEMGVVKKLWLSRVRRSSLYNTQHTSLVLAVLGLDVAQHGKFSAWCAVCYRENGEDASNTGGACPSFTTGLGACTWNNSKEDMLFLTKISVNVWLSWGDCFFIFFLSVLPLDEW